MLPDVVLLPSDLYGAIEDAEQASGARGVVDLLVAALTDPSVRSDAEIDPYLDQLKSACRQTRRYREAITVFERVAELNPARRPEMVAEIALAHVHLREPARAVALLEAAFAEQRRLPVRRRSAAFYVVAELAATLLRQPNLARQILVLSRTLTPVPKIRAASKPAAVEQPALWVSAVPEPKRPILTLVHSAPVAA